MKVLITIGSVILLFRYGYSQSFFAMKGLGEECLSADAYAQSLGNLSALTYENPAGSFDLKATHITGTLVNNFVLGKEGRKTRLITDIRPQLMRFKFPVVKRLKLGFKLSEVFNQNFEVYSDSIPHGNYWARRYIKGFGGIYNLSSSLGYELIPQTLSAGIEYGKLLGASLENWKFEILGGSNLTSDTVFNYYTGQNLRLGILVNYQNLILGFIVEDLLNLAVTEKIVSHNTVVSSNDSIKIKLPRSVSFGISYQFSNARIFSECFFRNWRNATLNNNLLNYENSFKVALGFEYLVNERYPIRAGTHYYRSYIKDRTRTNITQLGLSLGSRISLPNFGGIDYSLKFLHRYGRILKEDIWGFTLSLSYEELFKRRTRRWGS
ncbi:MAG: hypothetical protein NZ601_03530 [candidate division WOR-3 bacterium]|nr:hypothetical protein [candidate division WOR-3 bacterium]